ncbi:Gfo/Idh/MocA family oxidoreductase [Bacillus sp. FJAT-49711]|uniref:Gfo/Idh/MocA family protein n=1 Tax=Bacillus sp. FJAT-49711 TaxID=2833585 RepID=UPI001BC9CE3F|nr:Gfo/Idh/MocA family oxidoreductase [Bacillus sp. FJAT-49711]MBS4216953.1 Gfo/Idh/MocA family oxidoreductase [Bacillus sp. FJAT-49711]
MKNDVKVVLVGIGGYGNMYIDKFLADGVELNASIVGIVDPNPERSRNYGRIKQLNIPIFSMIEEFYANNKADLAVFSTPIHLHATQACYALLNGSNILCEKPMCASIEEAKKLIETRNHTGKFVAIGFNWSFSPSVQNMKQDILEGTFGKPKRLKTIVNWPRDAAYYNRNNWAGRLYSDDGAPILDSVANNATAHYLHHMFYLLGPTSDESARLKDVTSELYRANPIESFDTCAVKVTTEDDVEILYYATHAVKDSFGPQFYYEFEQANVYRSEGENGNQVVARFKDGTEKVYPDPEKDHLHKLIICIEAIVNGSQDIHCGPEAATPHVQAIAAMHESVSKIALFPENLIKLDKDRDVIWVEGLSDTLIECYKQWKLPSERKIPWAKVGKRIDVRNID